MLEQLPSEVVTASTLTEFKKCLNSTLRQWRDSLSGPVQGLNDSCESLPTQGILEFHNIQADSLFMLCKNTTLYKKCPACILHENKTIELRKIQI